MATPSPPPSWAAVTWHGELFMFFNDRRHDPRGAGVAALAANGVRRATEPHPCSAAKARMLRPRPALMTW
eukprot:scaffold18772_cov112-Isochrysis_galbana.AAC.3